MIEPILECNDTLMLDFIKYSFALRKQNEYLNKFKYCNNFGYVSEFTDNISKKYKQWIDKPLFNLNKDSEFSPDLSEAEIEGLKDPNLFSKQELITILNTLILKHINLEELLDERLERFSGNNPIVSSAQL